MTIVTLDKYIQEKVRRLNDLGNVSLPDPKSGGKLFQMFGREDYGEYIYFNCQSFKDYIDGINKIGNIRNKEKQLKPSDVEIEFSMRPYEDILPDEWFESCRRYSPYNNMENNVALSELLLNKLYDFGSNYGIRLFGQNSQFFKDFYNMLKHHPISQQYDIRDLGNEEAFMIGRSDVQRLHSGRGDGADNQVIVWGQKDCLTFVRNLAKLVMDLKISAHFGNCKSWSGPNNNHLVGSFYDPFKTD